MTFGSTNEIEPCRTVCDYCYTQTQAVKLPTVAFEVVPSHSDGSFIRHVWMRISSNEVVEEYDTDQLDRVETQVGKVGLKVDERLNALEKKVDERLSAMDNRLSGIEALLLQVVNAVIPNARQQGPLPQKNDGASTSVANPKGKTVNAISKNSSMPLQIESAATPAGDHHGGIDMTDAEDDHHYQEKEPQDNQARSFGYGQRRNINSVGAGSDNSDPEDNVNSDPEDNVDSNRGERENSERAGNDNSDAESNGNSDQGDGEISGQENATNSDRGDNNNYGQDNNFGNSNEYQDNGYRQGYDRNYDDDNEDYDQEQNDSDNQGRGNNYGQEEGYGSEGSNGQYDSD